MGWHMSCVEMSKEQKLATYELLMTTKRLFNFPWRRECSTWTWAVFDSGRHDAVKDTIK